MAGQIGGLDFSNPQARVAGTNPLIDMATSTLTGGLDPKVSALIDRGTSGGASVGQHSGLDKLNDWLNPLTENVVDAALADFDEGAGQSRALADLGLAGSGAFGGSGAALTKSMLEGELTRGRASTSAGLRSDAWNTAADYSSQDANRALQADQANAQLSESAASRALQAAGLLGNLNSQTTGQQLALGEYLRGIENETLNADLNLLGQATALTGSLPLNLFSGQKTTQSGGTLGAIGSGLLGAASLFGAPMTGGLSLGGLGGLFGGGAAMGSAAGLGSSLFSQVPMRFG